MKSLFETAILVRSTQMKSERKNEIQSLPPANYSSAMARAVEWLGDRYLLAKPINRSISRPGIVAPTRVNPGIQ